MPTIIPGQERLTPKINRPEGPNLSVDNTVVNQMKEFMPEHRFDNPHNFRYRLYNNDGGLRDTLARRMANERFSDPEIGEVDANMRQAVEKEYNNFIQDEILRTSYTGQEYNDAVFDRALELQELVDIPFRLDGFEELIKISPDYGELLERDQATGQKHVRFQDRTMLQRKIQSSPEIQKQLLWDKYKKYENMAEKRFGDVLNPEYNRDGYTQGFLLYSRYGEQAVQDFYDMQTEYDPDVGLREQVPEVLQARHRLLQSDDRDRLAPMDYLQLFYGEEGSQIGQFEFDEGTETDDLKYKVPKDMNNVTDYFYRNRQDGEIDMQASVMELLRDGGVSEDSGLMKGLDLAKRARDGEIDLTEERDDQPQEAAIVRMARDMFTGLREGDVVDYDSPYVHTAVNQMVQDGKIDPYDLMQVIASNARDHYMHGDIEGEDAETGSSVYVLGDLDELPEHAVWAADVLKLSFPGMITADKAGRLVFEPERQERVSESMGIQNVVSSLLDPFGRTQREEPVYDKWGNFRKYENEYKGNIAHTLMVGTLSAGQSVAGIIDGLGQVTSDFLGSDGSFGDNRLTQTIDKVIHGASAGEIPLTGMSFRDFADFNMSEEATDGWDSVGIMGGALAGYAVGSYGIGRLLLTGGLKGTSGVARAIEGFSKKPATAAMAKEGLGGVNSVFQATRTAKNVTNSSAILKRSQDIQARAKAIGDAVSTNPAFSMPLFSLGYGVTEIGTTRRPHWSMFGSGFIDQAVGYVGDQFNKDWDVNLQARYLSSDATVRYGYDFLGGEMLGVLFDGFHGLARYGIGKTFGPKRLKGIDFSMEDARYVSAGETRYMPLPSWQRAFAAVKRSVRDGTADAQIGTIGEAMAKNYARNVHQPFRPETKSEVFVDFMEQGGKYFKDMDNEIAENIRYYDNRYNAEPRSPEQLQKSIKQVKQDFFESLGRETIDLVGREDARLLADIAMGYNPRNIVESGMGRTVFSESEARRIALDNKDKNMIIQRADEVGPDGQFRYNVFELENADWTSDMAEGLYRSLAGRTLNQAIDDALEARGFDPLSADPGRSQEVRQIIDQVTNVFGREVDVPVIDNRLVPGARRMKSRLVQTGEDKPFGYRRGAIQGVDQDGKYMVSDGRGRIQRVSMAGVDELSTRPIDETAFREFSQRFRQYTRQQDIDPETGIMVGDNVQLYRNNTEQFPAQGARVTGLQTKTDGKLHATIEGFDDPVPVSDLTMVSRDVPEPASYGDMSPGVRNDLQGSVEASVRQLDSQTKQDIQAALRESPEVLESVPGGSPQIALLRSMGYSSSEIDRLLVQAPPVSQVEVDRIARNALNKSIEQGTEADVATTALTLREQGYTNQQIREMVDDFYRQNMEDVSTRIEDAMAGLDRATTGQQRGGLVSARNRAQSEIFELQRRRGRTMKVVNDTIENDGRIAEMVPEGMTTTKQAQQQNEAIARRADQQKQMKRRTREKHAEQASEPEYGNRTRSLEADSDYKSHGVATRYKSFIDGVSKIKNIKPRIMNVLAKIGAGDATDYAKLQLNKYANVRKKANKPVIEYFDPEKGGDVPAGVIVKKKRADGTGDDYFMRTEKKFTKGESTEPTFFTKVIRDGDETLDLHINEHWRPINRSAVLGEDGTPMGFVRASNEELGGNFGQHGFDTNDVVIRPAREGETPEFYANVQRPVRGISNERLASREMDDMDFAIRNDVDAIEYRSEMVDQPYYRIFSKHQMVSPEKFDTQLDIHKVTPELDSYMGPQARRNIGYGMGIGAIPLAMDQMIDFENEFQPSIQAGYGGLGLVALTMGMLGRGAGRVTRRASNAVRDPSGGSASKSFKNVMDHTVLRGRKMKNAEELNAEGFTVTNPMDDTIVKDMNEFKSGLDTAVRSGKDAVKWITRSALFQSNQSFFRKTRTDAGDKINNILQTVNNEINRLRRTAGDRFNNKHGPGAMERYIERGQYEEARQIFNDLDVPELRNLNDEELKQMTDQAFGALMESPLRSDGTREFSPAAVQARQQSDVFAQAMDALGNTERFRDMAESFDTGMFRKVKEEFDELIRRGISASVGEDGRHLQLSEQKRSVMKQTTDENGRATRERVTITEQEYKDAVFDYLSQNQLTFTRYRKQLAKENPELAEVLHRAVKEKDKGDVRFQRAVRYRDAGNSFTDLTGRYVPHILDYRALEARRSRFVSDQTSKGATVREAESRFDQILQDEWRDVNEQKFFKGKNLKTMEDGNIAPFRAKNRVEAGGKLRRIITDIETRQPDVFRQIEQRVGAITDENLEQAGFMKRVTHSVKKKDGSMESKEFFELVHPDDFELTTGRGTRQRPATIFDGEHNKILDETHHRASFDNAVRKSRFLERPREYEMPLSWRVNSAERVLNSYSHDVGMRLHFLQNNILDGEDFRVGLLKDLETELAERMRSGGMVDADIRTELDKTISRTNAIFEQITGTTRAVSQHTKPDDAYQAMLRQRRTQRNFNTMTKPMYGVFGYGFSFLDMWQTWITSGVYTSPRQVGRTWKQAFSNKQFTDDIENLARETNIIANKVDSYYSEFDKFYDPTAVRGDMGDKIHYYANKFGDAGLRFSFTRAVAPVFGADVSNFGAFKMFTDGLIGMNQLNTSVNMHAFLMESQKLARAAKRLENSGERAVRLDGQVYTMGRIRRELEQLGVPNDERSFRVFVDGEDTLMKELDKLGTGKRVGLDQLDAEHSQIIHNIITNSAETYHGLNKMNYPHAWGSPHGRFASSFLRFGYNIGLQTTQRRVRLPMDEWFETFSGKRNNPDLNRLQAGEVFYHYNRQDWDALKKMGITDEAINAFPAEAFNTVHRMMYANGVNVAGFMTLGIIRDLIAYPFQDYSDNTTFYSLILNPYASQEDQVSLMDLFGGDAQSIDSYMALIRYFAGKSGLYLGVGGGYMESAVGYGASRMRAADLYPPSLGIYKGLVDDIFGYVRSDYSDFREWGPEKMTGDIMSYLPVTGSRMVPRRAIHDAVREYMEDEQD